jgi:ornithine lipid ester-linked acyl 2-hydroxylase
MFMSSELVPFSPLIMNNLDLIASECGQVIENTPLWRETEIYDGSWRLFVFYDYEAQGPEGVAENLAMCPGTARILESIPGRHAASFSALGPKSRIKPHLGLDQGLLRFHCGIRVPPACTLGAMSAHAGLTLSDVISIPHLLEALQNPSALNDLIWRYMPSGLTEQARLLIRSDDASPAVVDAALVGIGNLIDDINLPIIAGEHYLNLDSCPRTAEWSALLQREGILRTCGTAPTITIEYESQVELVRWLNTAIVSEILFPAAFGKSMTFERRKLAERKPFIFSDAFIHDAQNDSEELRIVLLIDFDRHLYGLA